MHDEKTMKRFLSHVEKTTSCWLWIASLLDGGYGQTSVGLRRDGTYRALAAHRLAFELFKGPISSGMCVCHTCDVPRCVNPDHLWLGTQQENIQDMHRKGRWRPPRGELNGKGILRAQDVATIRKAAQDGVTQEKIAKDFGVSRRLIGMVVRGERWAHIGDGTDLTFRGRATRGRALLTENDVRLIRQEYAKGDITQAQLATRFGVHPYTISAVIRRKTWAHVEDL